VSAKGQERAAPYTIIGVIKDFHFTTMRETIMPLGIFLGETDGSVSFRFQSDDPKALSSNLEQIWKRLAPGQPFNFSFMDVDYANMYDSENKLARIFTIFSALAIFIACLGLFALASLTAQQRTREIGIRKALGATVQSILLLLIKDFGKLVLVAFALSVPIAHYAVSQWLSSYAYKTGIGLSLYLTVGGIICLITLFAVLFQSVKAASASPVSSLRNE